jgi:prepilin signal peptidase PulO-like enzyme (type II secretory pathway)
MRVAAVLVFAFSLASAAVCALRNDWIITEMISAYVTLFFMLWLAVTDIKEFVIPNKILLCWLAARVCLIVAGTLYTLSVEILFSSLAGALLMGLLFLLTYYLSKRTLGGGDVKYSFVMGLSLTLSLVVSAVFYGLVLCALFALCALLLKKMGRKDPVPLGPFLYMGTVTAYLLMI